MIVHLLWLKGKGFVRNLIHENQQMTYGHLVYMTLVCWNIKVTNCMLLLFDKY